MATTIGSYVDIAPAPRRAVEFKGANPGSGGSLRNPRVAESEARGWCDREPLSSFSWMHGYRGILSKSVPANCPFCVDFLI